MSDPVLDRMRDWFGGLKVDFNVPEEVDKFLKHEKQTNPTQLQKLADDMVRAYVVVAAGSYLRRIRGESRKAAVFMNLQQTADDLAAGERHSMLDDQYVIDAAGTRRFVADMTGADHGFVANAYNAESAKAKLLASFHLAVKKKVGSQKTGDVFTAEQYERMYRSIVPK